MRLLKRIIPALLLSAFFVAPVAATNSDASEINERDIQAVKQLLKVKRDQRLSDKEDDLNISGDIRFEFKHISEETKGTAMGSVKRNERGNGAGNGLGGAASDNNQTFFGANEFGIEFNLYFDYTAERTWAHAHLEFDNCAGISHSCEVNGFDYECGSGSCSEICLRSAYFGYNIFEEGSSRLDIEMGRWDMYAIFDSRVQFQHRYDCVLVTYSNSFEDVGDFYVKGGMFVIDSIASNWGYAVEVGLVDIVDMGLDVKYSFVDYKKASDRYGKTADGSGAGGPSPCVRAWNSRISQISAAYHFNPDVDYLNYDMKLYGAFIWNHSAKSAHTPAGVGSEDMAWYIGLQVGGIQGEGDWAIDVNYQSVEAQAVPGYAISGVGLGNVNGDCYHADNGFDTFAGNTNYQGFQLESAFALTDNLLFVSELEYTWEESSASGALKRDYMKSEIELMYSF